MFAFLRDLQDLVLLGRKVKFNRQLNQRPQVVRRDRVELDADGAEALRPAIARLGRPGRKAPFRYLLRSNCETFEVDCCLGAISPNVFSTARAASCPLG